MYPPTGIVLTVVKSKVYNDGYDIDVDALVTVTVIG
jgi:hypothetical protein